MAQSKQEIRERKQKWYAANFDKEMARMKAYRAENTERINETNQARYARDPQRILETNSKWRKAHPGYKPPTESIERKRVRRKERDAANAALLTEYAKKYYAENAEARRANTAKWVAANPEKAQNQNRRRRARKKAAEGSHTFAEWRELVKAFRGCCVCCKKHFGLRKLTEDHIMPLTRGGSDFIENIQPLCYSCNSSKGNHHSTDYRKATIAGKGQQRLFG